MRTNGFGRVAAVILGAEGLGILILVGWEFVALVTGDTGSIDTSLALLVLTAIGAVAVIAFAFAVAGGHSWGRSGGIVTQLLILAVALGAATGAYADAAVAVGLAIPAVLLLVLLFLTARAAHRDDADANGRTPER